MQNIIDFDPTKGQAFQGDVAIVPVPVGIKIERGDEVHPSNGRIILQEGEVTGHHHGITVLECSAETVRRSVVVDDLIRDVQANRIPVPMARLFRDPAAAQGMVRAGILTRSDLCVGFLLIEHGPMVVTHDEHAGIRLPIGIYYVGRQVESAGAEQRLVAD